MVATQELLDSTSRTLIERFSSPLLGSFTIAWGLWNWQFIVVLFSDNPAIATFRLVEEVVYPSSFSLLWKGLVAPAASAILYVFAYPYAARVVFGYLLRQQQETNKVRQRIEGEALLSREESQRILLLLRKQDRSHAEERQQLLEEIQLLKTQIDVIEKREERAVAKEVAPAKASAHPSLSNTQKRVIKMLGAHHPDALSISDIALLCELTQIETEHALGELEPRELVQRRNLPSGIFYKLTHSGQGIFLDIERPE